MNLLVPLRFRFTEPDDVRMYGDCWYVHDEAKIARLPARELAKLEQEIGIPLIQVLQEFRRDTVMARLAAAWIAVRLADPAMAGNFDDFSPLVLLLTWHPVVEDAPREEMQAPLDPADSTTSPSTQPTE